MKCSNTIKPMEDYVFAKSALQVFIRYTVHRQEITVYEFLCLQLSIEIDFYLL